MTTSKRVLVVEDDAELRADFKSIVEEAGYDVDEAGNRKEALEKIRCRTYHVAMVDIMLTDDPLDRGGIDVIKYIGALKEGTQAVVLSASPDVRVPVEAWKQGAVSYLIKKDIGSSADILAKVAEACRECQILPYGRFSLLSAYLAAPEQTPYFEAHLMSVFQTGIELVTHILHTTFHRVEPFLRPVGQAFSLRTDTPRGVAHGLFWSKAYGHAVYVSMARDGCDYIVPETTQQEEPLFERSKADLKAAVWKTADKRGDFMESLHDV